MCGIAGIAGNGICDADLEVLEQMSRVLVVRGRDGSGIVQASAYQKGYVYNFQTAKSASEMSDFMWWHQRGKTGNRDLFRGRTENFFGVHVRAATKGNIIAENAHPFEIDRLVGMHNGTLLDKRYQSTTGGTDSEMMFKDIAERGARPVLSELQNGSAYAIVMFDKKTGEITIARNRERPLFCAWHKQRKVFYWASEHGLLEWILTRNGINFDKIFFFTTDTIHKFGPWDVRAGSAPNWKLEPVKEEEKKTVVVQPASQTFLAQQITENKKLKQEKKEEKKKPTLSLVQGGKTPPLNQPSGGEGSKAVYPRSRLHVSCMDCGRDMDLLDQFQGYELSVGNYICKSCDDIRDGHWKQNNPVIH